VRAVACADPLSSALKPHSIGAVPIKRFGICFDIYFPLGAARARTDPFSMISATAGKACCAGIGTDFQCRSGA
jgi:hypothetical protein